MTDAPSPASQRPPYWSLSVYAIAMALLEAAVVVYLRKLYHPHGFRFPLSPIPYDAAFIEIAREGATVTMIGAVAILAAGRSGAGQFAAFAYVFGVWDIFYYVFLAALIHWPQGLLDPDVLFLIPLPWVGPVLAPVLVSVQLIALALVMSPPRAMRDAPPALGRLEWGLFLAGAALILWTFVETNLTTTALGTPIYYPERYGWPLFLVGWTMGWMATLRLAAARRRIIVPIR